jgi:uncharacterized protein
MRRGLRTIRDVCLEPIPRQMSETPRSARLPAAIGLAIITALIVFHGNDLGHRFLGMTALQSRDLFWWSLLALLLLYIALVERRPFSSIGIRRPRIRTLVAGLAFAAVLIFVVGYISNAIIVAFELDTTAGSEAAQAIDSTPVWYRVLLIARGSIAEEVVFRGYLIERVRELTGSRVLAVFASVALFSLAHLHYWGWVPLIFVSLAGIVAALQYLWLRDLVGNIITHYVTDASQMLL